MINITEICYEQLYLTRSNFEKKLESQEIDYFRSIYRHKLATMIISVNFYYKNLDIECTFVPTILILHEITDKKYFIH